MKQVLKSLNEEVGVKGSLIITHDGVVIASELSYGLQEELVAAITSATIKKLKQTLTNLNIKDFKRFILNATHGKIVFEDIGEAFLVVVLDKKINLDITLISISGAAHRIKNLGQIRI